MSTRLNELEMVALGPIVNGLTENSPLTEEDRRQLIRYSEATLKIFKEIGMDYPSHLLETTIIPALKKSETTYKQAYRFLEEFGRSYGYEIKDVTCLIIPANKAVYLDQDIIFDKSVLDKFISISYEIDEAHQCFALDRYSACVFHLMRILEAGLNELAKKFNIEFTRTNWQNIIDQIEKAVKDISFSSHGSDWKQVQHSYSEVCTHFRFLKDSWRNYAMHIHEQYSEERAKKIMDNVASFMKDLAGLI